MKKINILFIILSIFILISCNEEKKEELIDDAVVEYGKFTNSEYLYEPMHLYHGEDEIPVYACKINFSHTWNAEAPQRINNGVAIIELEGRAKLRLKTNFKINNKVTIRPLNKEVDYEQVEDQILDFYISEVGQYTIEFSNDRTLHLFVNPLHQYDEYKNQSNIIYFGPGVHNRSNSSKIASDNLVHLSTNQIVFIDKGAIVEAGFIANNSSNIKIIGNGIISGAPFDRNANTNTKLIPFEFNYCHNLEFQGIFNLDPAGWCYNIYFCDNVKIDNIKIISSRSNGDGVSIQSCQNVECNNSFIRSWDDSLVVKNYPRWDNRNIEGTTKNIQFNNCIIWTDLAQSMEIGYETVGLVMEDIHFKNITVLHNFHKAVISIHNGNNANIKDVSFENIIVEDASMGRGDGKNTLIELTAEYSTTWSNGHKTTSLGSVNGVLINNVKVLKANNPMISLRGSIDPRDGYTKDIHYVENVTIKDLFIENKKIDSNYNKLETIYTKNIVFE